MDDDHDEEIQRIAEVFNEPLLLEDQYWVQIKKLARSIMDDLGIEYSKALVVAYMEWFEMAQMDLTRH